jgi:hypothetical protein
LTHRSATNYFAWYVTTTFDARLFDDFQADACLIIHDAAAFDERLFAAFERLRPHWIGAPSHIRYFDPLRTEQQALAAFDKEFRFTYQREYRFAWDPPQPEVADASLAPADLDLGNLEDIASLITI